MKLLYTLIFSIILSTTFAQQPSTELLLDRTNWASNQIDILAAFFPELNGNNIHISVKEQGFDTLDIDLAGRIRTSPLRSLSDNRHATTMATIIAGNGNSGFEGRGVAPAAFISSSDFLPLLPAPNEYYQNAGISVENHSYGTTIEAFYGDAAAAYDQSVLDKPDLLHIFSVGNLGEETPEEGLYAGIPATGNLSGNFKMAKNILTIGATTGNDDVDSRSSRGPAYDGRVKPELVAYGQDGSSGAAALTSGLAAVLQQAYQKQTDTLPPAALLKAVLIAGARDINQPGPDFSSGYGAINAQNSLAIIQQLQFAELTITPADTSLLTSFTLPANAANLRIALCWSDPTAKINAEKAIVNDLDMELRVPNSDTLLRPWVLSSFPHPDSLRLPARRSADHLNNIELISLQTPDAGRYEIHIRPYQLQQKQSCYLAYFYEQDNQLTWQSPAITTPLISGQDVQLRWHSTLADTTAALEYRTQQTNWIRINDTISLKRDFYDCALPSITSEELQWRILTQHDTFPTQTFRLEQRPQLIVEYNCTDSLMVSWAAIPGATDYTLLQLHDNELQTLALTNQPFFIINKNTLQTPYLSLQANYTGGATGTRALTLNIEQQRVACYANSFFATLLPNGNARLELQLSTLTNIKSVEFSRVLDQGNEVIARLSPPEETRLQLIDNQPVTGLNIYQADVILVSGDTISPLRASTVAPGDDNHLLYPNPVTEGETAVLLNKVFGEDITLQLVDSQGREVQRLTLFGSTSFIDTYGFAPGVYWYHIFKNKERLYSGKLMITP